MEAIWGLIFGLFILLGFEMRIRMLQEDIADLRQKIVRLVDDLLVLEEKLRGKKDAFEQI